MYGTWERDGAATLASVEESMKMNEYQEKALPAMLTSPMRITYRQDGTGAVWLGEYNLPKLDGGEIQIEEVELEFTYEILGESENQVVIKVHGDDPVTEKLPFTLWNFEGPDRTFGVFEASGITNWKGREYFKRVEP